MTLFDSLLPALLSYPAALALTLVLALVGCGQASQPASSGGEESQEGDTITIVDHNDNTVQVPRDVQRIVVCDILPLPSVLAVFFDSAEKIVGMTDTSMSAAKNGLLGHAGIGPKAFGRIPGEKLRHGPFHPHIQRKRLQAA